MREKPPKIAPVSVGRGGMLVCSICDKASYATEEQAAQAARRAHDPMYYYFGPDCRWWHLTRSPPSEVA